MSRLNEDQIAEYQETFNLFDNRGDGKICVYQVGDVLRAMNQNPTESEVKKCCKYDDPESRITFEQFLPIYQTVARNRDTTTAEDFIEGFKVFDKEQNGTITSAELRHLLSSLGEKMNDDECEQLLAGQEDQHGNIPYEDFVKMVMSG